MRSLAYLGCVAALLGVLGGCAKSNEEDFMATSGPGWTPPGAPVDGTGPPIQYIGGEAVPSNADQ